jgi:formate dehydrogenase major subunit
MPPDHEPAEDSEGPGALRGDEPFVMQADGRGWLFAPSGVVDGPLPTHYEPDESPFSNALHPARRASPLRERPDRPENPANPPQDDDYPYVVTTYRLTEHHTAGGMSRWLPYLAELQPEFFCEVSPALAAERGLRNGGWATIVSARAQIEARVLVTDRMTTLTVHGRPVHQVGLPYHWGGRGLSTGDSANDLLSIVMDPNTGIGEYKAATCDIRPGRRGR